LESRILSRNDVAFLLYDWLKVEALTERPVFAEHSRETFDAVLELCERLATDKFANHNRKGDLEEAHIVEGKVRMAPEVSEALTAYSQAGLMAGGHRYELGGMQLPMVVERAGFAWFLAANMSTSAIPFLTMGNANLLLAYATQEAIDLYVRPMLAGRFFGTMCLSEPHAGSSLAEIRTQAVPQGDGSYRLFGNKMWISAGDHELGENIVHLVLARLRGAPAGVKGISLFLVPRKLLDANGTPGERNDVALAGLNHKMGTRGVPNCLLNFGEGAFKPGGSAGAVGWLVGEPNAGLAAMFHMMNESRVGVGLMAAAVGYTAYLHALEYARERLQGYHPGSGSASARQVPIIEHADVRRMLLAQKCYAEGALALNLYCARLVDEERTAPEALSRERAHLLLELLTPIAKSWPAQWCLEGCNLAIQVHGGYGYTRDYNVEQFYRDNRLNAIHEGTHGIQALDLLGRKVSMEHGAGFGLLCETIRNTIARARADTELGSFAASLDSQLTRIEHVTTILSQQVDAEARLANASAYLEALGHFTIAWIWLEQMLVASANTPFHLGKRQAGRYFFRWELPKISILLDRLTSLDDTTLQMEESWF
jgi:alkylation response protein AidB-like acyl-CoA dehydrogenase